MRTGVLRGLVRGASRPNEPLAAVAAAILFAVFLSRGTLVDPGWIGLRHDWTTLPFPGQWAVWAQSEFFGFTPTGIGTASGFPNDWIVVAPYALFATFLNAETLSKGTIVLIPALAGLGTYLLARTALGLRPAAAAFAAFVAMCGPVMFNRIVAGQLSFLWALALFPAWLATYRRAGAGAAWALASACLAAVVSAQLQFVAFVAIVVVLDALLWRERSGRAFAIAALATAAGIVVAQAGTLVALPQRFGDLSHGVASIPAMSWVQSNSAPFGEALQLRGYVAGYFEGAYGAAGLDGWLALGWVFVATVVAGALATLRRPAGRFLIVLWLLGASLAAALDGPFAPVLAILYARLRPMQMFRESYHWASLSGLAAALLAGCALEWALGPGKGLVWRWSAALEADTVRRWAYAGGIRAGWVVLPLVVATAAYCWPAFDGEWSGGVQTVTLTAGLRTAYAQIAATHAADRTLWLPEDQPVALKSGSFAGTDPLAYTDPPAAWEYALSPPVSTLVMNLRGDDLAGTDALLGALGIGRIVYRDELVSRLPDFFFKTTTHIDRYYTPRANLRGVVDLGWPLRSVGAGVAVFAPPRPNGLVAVADGTALVSPDETLLAALPPSLSPTLEPVDDTAAVVLERDDLPATIAAFGGARDLLRGIATLPTDDAAHGWAPFAEWWPYREAYARIFDASLITLRRGATLVAGRAPGASRLVVAYAAGPAGGRLRVACGNAERTVETRADGGFAIRSAVLATTAPCRVVVRNERGEELLRHLYVVSPAGFAAGAARLQRLERHARFVRLIPGEVTGAAVASGPHPAGTAATTLAARLRFGGTVVDGTLPPGAGALRLRTAFSPAWRLALDGRAVADHRDGDLYANLWTFAPSDRPRSFEIRNVTALEVGALHAFAALVWLLAACGSLALSLRARRRRHRAVATSIPSPTV